MPPKQYDIVFCDLDGTLWPGDLTHLCIRLRPLKLIKALPILFFKGRVAFKKYLAKGLILPLNKICFFSEVVDWLHTQKKSGARIILITGSVEDLAAQLLTQLPCIDAIHGTTSNVNLVGKNKGEFIAKHYPHTTNIYLGNEWKDRFVWQHCSYAGAVNPNIKTKKWLEKRGQKTIFFYPKK